MTAVTVALDWEPNANHIGFYVAREKGWYKEAGLDVTLTIPDAEYSATPASKVALGEAHFAVTPSETVVSYATQPDGASKPRIKAVASLLQRDPSAIVTLKKSGVARPRDLDGKVYASYGARYEGRIVQQLIKADGGSGDYQERALPMLGIWSTLLEGKADATWVFANIEGVAAQQKGVELNVFHLGDYNIPYGYSPVLVASEDYLREQSEVAKKLVSATARGYEWAAANGDEAADLLVAAGNRDNPSLTEPLESGLIRASTAATAPLLLDGGKWGRMDEGRWDEFLDWLSEYGLLTTSMQSRSAPSGDSKTLDELRAGNAGDSIDRSTVEASALFTNDFFAEP
mmetsp:Transcript_19011/g.57443  ORF Transcript_19011/g.57443 Transcript_19011/m.57443 type:complete len:344 (+) Transcript_19011:176-1207(+)